MGMMSGACCVAHVRKCAPRPRALFELLTLREFVDSELTYVPSRVHVAIQADTAIRAIVPSFLKRLLHAISAVGACLARVIGRNVHDDAASHLRFPPENHREKVPSRLQHRAVIAFVGLDLRPDHEFLDGNQACPVLPRDLIGDLVEMVHLRRQDALFGTLIPTLRLSVS